MSQVDFYHLPINCLDNSLDFICKLTNKIWQQAINSYIHCQTDVQRQLVDKLLWQYKADSFIPHSLLEEDINSPIVLGLENMDYQQLKHSLLINLNTEPPKYYQQFERIIEFVVIDPQLTKQARHNYRFYKEAQYSIKYHAITRL